jgi:hypothetical protein
VFIDDAPFSATKIKKEDEGVANRNEEPPGHVILTRGLATVLREIVSVVAVRLSVGESVDFL